MTWAASLGFPTKRAAARHLHEGGAGVHVIASAIGSSIDAVRTSLCQMGLRPHPQSTHEINGQCQSMVILSPDTFAALRSHAARRGLTVAAIAALIIDTVAIEGIVDAALDDGEG